MLAHSLRRCREWCRCSDDSWPKRLRLRVETVGWKRRRALTEAANTSARRNDEDACLPPCKPHPSPHRRVSPGPGSEKGPDRNKVAIRSFSVVAYSSVLGILAYRTYTDEPPIPSKVIGANGQLLFTGEDVLAGQEVFLKNGLMEYGSIFGHGAYLGPD